MPRRRLGRLPHTGEYPADWAALAQQVKDESGWCCERCGHPHEPAAGYGLTVHHLDDNKGNCARWNLAALCQRCHLAIQGKVVFAQAYMFEHTAWMRPHVEGMLAARKEQEGAST